MVYIPHTDQDRQEMLKAIGVSSLEELISNIPPSLRLRDELDLPEGKSEFEVFKKFRSMAAENISVNDYSCFLGGGAYDHYVPAIVDYVISRPEFYTAYTPYQAELSQGTLHAMYEFQSCVSILSGLDVSNASMYDGASALAEAALMSMNITRRNKIIYSSTLHPHYQAVLKTYFQGMDCELVSLAEDDGITSLSDLKEKLDENTACVLIQHPNFYGCLEEVDEINSIIKSFNKVQYVVSYNPVSVGLLKSPGEYGADTATAEGQPLGIPLNFGGPYLGLFSTRQENIRKMPGRMAGKTIDSRGKEGFVLALQTREQHIKRERATSNICTNQGLMAVAALTYMAWAGKKGLREIAIACYNKAHYLAREIDQLPGFSLKFKHEFFNEFVVQCEKDPQLVLDELKKNKIFGGINLNRFGKEGILVAVTEKRSREELDKYIHVLKSL